MQYKNGYDFEFEVLGCRSSGRRLVEKFKKRKANFSEDVTELVRKPGPEYPNTRIGKSLYSIAKQELGRLGVSTKGFIFRSVIGTKADARHLTDALFYLPEFHRFPITVDLFCISSDDVRALKDLWVDRSTEGGDYSELDFQSDLFLFNKGLFAWMKENQILDNAFVCPNLGNFRKKISRISGNVISVPLVDFREYADSGRPENHFLLTPYHIEKPEQRKEFAKLVAGYFAKLAGVPNSHKTAQQSH